jgi:hypothetical protein
MKRLILAAFFAAVVFLAVAAPKPKDGFVPDAKTAIKIAVAVWEPIYGEVAIAKEKPYRAKLLTNTVWKVEGSLPGGIDMMGGVATAFISKSDGKILNVYHTK